MKSKILPPLEELARILSYCPMTGEFRWKVRFADRLHVGEAAGYLNKIGYRRIGIRGTLYLAHRIAWKLTTGSDPEYLIDHINGIRDDNRIDNLREARRSQNSANAVLSRRNTSGVKGCSWKKRQSKWEARIRHDGVSLFVGLFDDLSAAAAALRYARIERHGEFAHHG